MTLSTLHPSPPTRRALAALIAGAAIAGPVAFAGLADAAVPRGGGTGACHAVDFDDATVASSGSGDPFTTRHVLTVTGSVTGPAEVTLVKAVYVRQPEHWEFAVTACPDAGGTVAAPPEIPPLQQFSVAEEFVGPVGTCGIEVAGATTRQTFDLDGPGCLR
jgi:hypothetical protein